MARPGTDLERRRETSAYERAANAFGTRIADVLDRRRRNPAGEDPSGSARIAGSVALKMASSLDRLRDAGAIEANPPPITGHPAVDRLAGALERRLARAVERRLGGRSDDRVPGALERRIVAALTRRMGDGSRSAEAPSTGLTAAVRRTGRALMTRRGRPLRPSGRRRSGHSPSVCSPGRSSGPWSGSSDSSAAAWSAPRCAASPGCSSAERPGPGPAGRPVSSRS